MDKKEMVNNTLDMAHYKKHLWVSIAFLPLFLAVCITGFFSPDGGVVALSFMLLLLIYLPAIAYNVYKVKALQKDPDRYELFEATAVRAHHAIGAGRGAMYFEVMITSEDGGKVFLETNGVFSRALLAENYYKDYEDQKIRILYDRTTGTVLVLKDK